MWPKSELGNDAIRLTKCFGEQKQAPLMEITPHSFKHFYILSGVAGAAKHQLSGCYGK